MPKLTLLFFVWSFFFFTPSWLFVKDLFMYLCMTLNFCSPCLYRPSAGILGVLTSPVSYSSGNRTQHKCSTWMNCTSALSQGSEWVSVDHDPINRNGFFLSWHSWSSFCVTKSLLPYRQAIESGCLLKWACFANSSLPWTAPCLA